VAVIDPESLADSKGTYLNPTCRRVPNRCSAGLVLQVILMSQGGLPLEQANQATRRSRLGIQLIHSDGAAPMLECEIGEAASA
jgi:hypothetical protein